MRYGSVCSGIEAATAAWHHLGWEAAFFSEIEAFPSAVLTHHYPTVPLHGDFTTIEKNQYGKIDLLVGGTPCQSFSVAGLRGGLDDERGNLALEFCRLAQREQPRWIVWENVPGVLSSNGGRDFGSILGALEDLGYGLAYRVLDAQYFGVAQRRRRVFVVGYLGDWRRAAAVLFERNSMCGHPAPSREARKEATRNVALSPYECGGVGSDSSGDISSPLLQSGADKGHGCEALIAGGDGPAVVGTLRTRRPGEGGVQGDFDHIVPVVSPALNTQSGSHHAPDTKAYVVQPYSIMPMNSGKDYKARETDVAQPIMAGGPVGGNQGGDFIVAPFGTTQVTSPHNYSNPKAGDPCHPLAAGSHPPAIAIQDVRGVDKAQNGKGWSDEGVSYTVDTHATQGVAHPIAFSAKDHGGDATENMSPTLRAGGHSGSHANAGVMPAVAYPINTQMALRGANTSNTSREGIGIGEADDPAFTLQAAHSHAVAFQTTADCLTAAYGTKWNGNASATNGSLFAAEPFTIMERGREGGSNLESRQDGTSNAILTPNGGRGGLGVGAIAAASAVRRLTPVECERLQGFPDNFTAIPWKKKDADNCPDGPRYKALGNSMAVPVMRWIGERIQLVDDLTSLL